ncbi:MAG: signal peptidase II [Rhodospirillaceae bacterium]|nr:signal peptidase II [Rhodospirillaceae bacterium]
MRLGLSVAAVVLILDQLSKALLLEALRPEGVSQTPFFTDTIIEVLPFFNFRMAWNTGISFSLFDGGGAMTYILLGVTSAITVGLIWWLRAPHPPLMRVTLGLVIGGAVGNIIDRARWGAVADFFDFHVAGWHFATFNVADSCISIGVGLLLLDALLRRPQHTTKARDSTDHG